LNFEICYSNLTSKTLLDLKIDIWILNCYFGILNLYLIQKIIDWVIMVFSTSVIDNKSLLQIIVNDYVYWI
jgi:hypothetical protein